MKKNFQHQGGFKGLGASLWTKTFRRFLNWDEQYHFKLLPVSFLLVGIFLLLVQSKGFSENISIFIEGEIAKSTVRSPQDIEIEDFEANRISRENYVAKVPLVFDYDVGALADWNEKWKSNVQSFRIAHGIGSRIEKTLVEQKMGITLSDSEFETLRILSMTADFERVTTLVFASLWKQKIIDSRNVNLGMGGAEIVTINTGKSIHVSAKEFSNWLSIDDAQEKVLKVFTKNTKRQDSFSFPWHRWKSHELQNIKSVLLKMLRPNVTFNRKESEDRRVKALADMKPLVTRLIKNEVIVREGDKVNKRQEQILNQLSQKLMLKEKPAGRGWEWVYGSLVFWMLLFFLGRQYPKLLQSNKDSLLMAAMLLIGFAVFKISVVFGFDVLGGHFLTLPKIAFIFLIPTVAPAMIVRLLLHKTHAVIFSVFYAAGCILIFEKSLLFGILTFSNCMVGILFIAACRTRADFYRAGFLTALWCALGSMFIYKIAYASGVSGSIVGAMGKTDLNTTLWIGIGGFFGGLQASVLAMALTPILESILDYTTDLKLLELARMDHPLLKELVMKAPGTYHHSIVVGSLVEAGAEAIGANALLARVGSYYHDIGKIGRAEYFVENQGSQSNPHDTMRPQLSAKMIISHVKEGVELARKHGLGQSMIDFIEQHHGTTLVHYFYNKAKQEAAQPGSSVSPDEIREEDFKYPGPNPQNKETAIMALADKCEAATRSLVDPTPARIQAIVHKIIMKSLEEGLLTDADINIRELHLVESAFLRILLGIYHARVQYPDQEKGLPQASSLSVVSGGGSK